MTRRGYVGTLYLNRSSLLLRDTLHRELSPKHLSLFLHERAVARLDRLALAPDEQALCNAMTAGDRRSLSPALRAAYSRSGTSHLLAVSGLHVGIVFLARQPAALVAAALPTRTHPAQYRGHPAHLALCRHDGIPAQRRPGRADVLRPAIRPGLVVGIRR